MPERTNMVDAVDWTSSTSNPEGVQAALHALWSGDDDLRRSAYNFLAGQFLDQGERFPAGAEAVPFLIDVVADPAARDRFGACQLLRMIAVGDESVRLIERTDPAADRARAERQAEMSLADLEGEMLAWVAAAGTAQERQSRQFHLEVTGPGDEREALRCEVAAHEAVRAHLPVLLAALGDDDPAVRLHTAHLLAWFPEDRATVVPALTRLIVTEPAEIAAVAAVAAVLAGGTPADTALIGALEALRTGAAAPGRWAAAIALARMTGKPAREVTGQIYECLLEAGDAVPDWPFLDGDMSALAAVTLAGLDPEVAADRVGVLAARLRGSSPEEGDRAFLIGALLDAAFPAGEPVTALTGVQHAAARALDDAEAWLDGPYVQTLLAAAGLPEEGPYASQS